MSKLQTNPSAGGKPLSRSMRIYQKAAIFFVIISLLLLLMVLYLSVSKAVITITPNPVLVSSLVPVEITENPSGASQVRGFVFSDSYTKAKTFSIPKEGASITEEKAGGMVTLINDTVSDQQLIATTRLLSEEGILFRLDEGVIVPADSQIEAMVHADEVGAAGDVGPTQFTIPGLNASLQTSVYAVSVESMTGGVQYVRVVSQEDLDTAISELKDEILEESKSLLGGTVDKTIFDGQAYIVEEVERMSDTEPGVEAGQFTISYTAKVTGIFYAEDSIAKYVEGELYKKLQTGYQVVSVNREGLQSTVQSTDEGKNSATLEVYIDGFGAISSGSDLLDLDGLAGKSASEVTSMLLASEGVAGVTVDFTPFWLKRVPKLKDHISIIIEDAE